MGRASQSLYIPPHALLISVITDQQRPLTHKVLFQAKGGQIWSPKRSPPAFQKRVGWDIFSFAVGVMRSGGRPRGTVSPMHQPADDYKEKVGGFKDAVGRLWEVEETVRKL